MEEKRTKYFSVLEKITKELFQKNIPNQIVSFTASRFSEAFNDKLHYAFIHRRANKIIGSTTADNIIQSILPFFLNDKFIEEIDKLDWSALDSRGIHLLLDRVFNLEFDLNSSILIIPRKKGKHITHFSALWGGSILKRIDKEDIDFISSVCSAVEIRMVHILSDREAGVDGAGVSKKKELKPVETAGGGFDISASWKNDFFGGFLLNIIGELLSKTAVIFLSINENNTEFRAVVSRGVHKKLIDNIHITGKNSFVDELKKKNRPLMIADLIVLFNEDDINILKRLEASVLVPLISSKGMIGILTLGERINLTPYTEKLLATAKALSRKLAVDIENSKAFNFRYMLSRHISPEVLPGILQNSDGIKLGGERRKVAVLFAGIQQFAGIAGKMNPEEVVDLLNNLHSGLTEIVFKYEGTLDKYIGDLVMAVFGAPNAHYNDVERAVFTAVDMKKYIDEINIKRKGEGLRKITLGIGISTGEAVAGNMGVIDRIDYTVVGYSVNTAMQLEKMARKGQILTTAKVYDEVKYLVDACPLVTKTAEGRGKTFEVYEIRDLIAYRYISAIEKREPYIIGHFLNIARDVELIGRRLEFSGKELTRLRLATMLIDVGRIGLPEGIFNKKGKLTEGEFEIVKSHAIRGAEKVKDNLQLFRDGVELVKHHHEFYDGTGYPDGLKGEGISLWARIVCVVDSYQAMIEKRPYREPYSEEKAADVLKEERGKKYDPQIVDTYLEILNRRIKEKEIVEV